MSAKKMDKSAHEPGWGEVILGAVLSMALGAALGFVALVLRPVAVVKEMPKEPAKGVVYVLEGSRDTTKSRQAPAKRKAFASGQSVTVTEEEINSLLKPLPVAAPPPAAAQKQKAGDKNPPAKAPAPAAAAANAAPGSDDLIAFSDPNLRIRDGAVQLIVPVTFNVLGLDSHVMVTATGSFVKKDAGFVFEPSSMMIGSCPLDRIPAAAGLLAKKFLTAKSVPEDIATAWGKLSAVAVEGNSLKLTMP